MYTHARHFCGGNLFICVYASFACSYSIIDC